MTEPEPEPLIAEPLSYEAATARLEEIIKRLDSLAAAIAAHDPERVIARGYAVVDDREGNLLTSAAAAREAGAVRLFFADADVDARIEE